MMIYMTISYEKDFSTHQFSLSPGIVLFFHFLKLSSDAFYNTLLVIIIVNEQTLNIGSPPIYET